MFACIFYLPSSSLSQFDLRRNGNDQQVVTHFPTGRNKIIIARAQSRVYCLIGWDAVRECCYTGTCTKIFNFLSRPTPLLIATPRETIVRRSADGFVPTEQYVEHDDTSWIVRKVHGTLYNNIIQCLFNGVKVVYGKCDDNDDDSTTKMKVLIVREIMSMSN